MQRLTLNENSVGPLLEKIVSSGDLKAYNKAWAYFMFKSPHSFLYYALIMANQYDHVEAYYHVFQILAPLSGEPLNKLDERTRSIALFYLLKSHEKGCEPAKHSVSAIFGNEKVPKSATCAKY